MISRYVSSAPPGLAVTLALLWGMQSLLDSASPVQVDGLSRLPPVFTVPRRDPPPPETTEPPPERIAPPMRHPQTRVGTAVDEGPDDPLPIDWGPGHPPLPGPGDYLVPGNPGVSDGPPIGIVKVAPEYPPAAARQGLEGFVLVQFDVTAAGSVENVRVLESSHAVFEPPAVRAAYRFRFRPRVVDGAPVASRNVVNRFRYTMKDD